MWWYHYIWGGGCSNVWEMFGGKYRGSQLELSIRSLGFKSRIWWNGGQKCRIGIQLVEIHALENKLLGISSKGHFTH